MRDEHVAVLPGSIHAEASWSPAQSATLAEAKPFLRWAGGKTRLLKAILPHVPRRFRTYHEPFLGSGALFFAVRDRASAGHQLSDLNGELINIWQVVRDQPGRLLTALRAYDGRDNEVDYYCVRGAAPRRPVQRAARFFYLNQTAWNGLWRVNRWGVFNVPWGARPFRGISRASLLSVSDALQGVVIRNEDFRAALANVEPDDFVYLDPPYLPVSDTSKFSGYTGRRFRRPDLAELADVTRELSAKGIFWVMSNRDTVAIRELFAHARIERFTTWRAVSAQNRRNVEPAESPEVIVIGGGS